MTPLQEDRISGLDIYRTEALVFLKELIDARKIKPSKNHLLNLPLPFEIKLWAANPIAA